jgi:uncharacterized protein
MRGGRESDRSPGPGWALVTGASSGIGVDLARAVARRGWNVILTARREDRLRTLERELRERHGVEALTVPEDLASPEGRGRLFQRVEEEGLEVELLVNNAGIGDYGPFAKSDRGRTMGTVELNVVALTELTHHFLPGMVSRGRGWVLNVASSAAFQPGPLMSVYYATKAYVLSLSEGLREEVRRSGVGVTALCPGPTVSEFQEKAGVNASYLGAFFPRASSERAAEVGVRALFRGRPVAVVGVTTRLQTLLLRILPRRVVPGIMRRIQERR